MNIIPTYKNINHFINLMQNYQKIVNKITVVYVYQIMIVFQYRIIWGISIRNIVIYNSKNTFVMYV